MILANEQVAGYLADRKLPTLYRVHEKPDPLAVEAMVAQLASLDMPTPALPEQHEPAAGGRRGRRGLAAGRGRGRAAAAAGGGRSARWCCARSSRPTTRRATSATPAWPARATATSRRRSAATPTWWCTARCSAASGSTRSPRAPTSSTRPGIECQRARARGDEDRALGRRRLPGVPARAHALRARSRCSTARSSAWWPAGAFVRFGDEGFEGFLPARRLRDWYELNEEGTALIGRDSGRALRIGDPIKVAVERIEAPRGRVDLMPAGLAG